MDSYPEVYSPADSYNFLLNSSLLFYYLSVEAGGYSILILALGIYISLAFALYIAQ
jgi:hypothetical protein